MSDQSVNPYEVSESSPVEVPSVPRKSKSRRHSLVAMYVVCAIVGSSQVFAYDHPGISAAFSLLLAGLATSWAIADTRARGEHFIGILGVLYFLTWPLAALVYLVATRRLRGLGWWLLNAVGLYAALFAAHLAVYLVIYLIGREDLIDPALFE